MLCAPILFGCSGGLKLAPVEGTVTLDGVPLAKGTITFESTGNRPAIARIENGKIVEATTYTTGDGVPVGEHTVAISATEDAASAVTDNPGMSKSPGANYMVGKSLIPAAYNNPSTSGLTATIQPGGNTVEFKLVSKGP